MHPLTYLVKYCRMAFHNQSFKRQREWIRILAEGIPDVEKKRIRVSISNLIPCIDFISHSYSRAVETYRLFLSLFRPYLAVRTAVKHFRDVVRVMSEDIEVLTGRARPGIEVDSCILHTVNGMLEMDSLNTPSPGQIAESLQIILKARESINGMIDDLQSEVNEQKKSDSPCDHTIKS